MDMSSSHELPEPSVMIVGDSVEVTFSDKAEVEVVGVMDTLAMDVIIET